MSFAAQLAAFAEKTKGDMDLVVRVVTQELAEGLITRSPVDTGRFKGNWQIGVGSVNYAADSPIDKDGSAALARIKQASVTMRAGGVVFLTNSLPYAQRLEYGWSQRAPNGMVRIVTAEFRTYLTKALAI